MEQRKILDKIYKDTFSLESISCVYSQDPDCVQDNDDCQVIKLETVSNGIGSFVRISLPEGGYWSINGRDDLLALYDDFKSRFDFEDETN